MTSQRQTGTLLRLVQSLPQSQQNPRQDSATGPEPIRASYTDAFRHLIYVKANQHFDVDVRRYLPTILECDTPEMTLKAARQVGKTWSIGGKEILHGAGRVYSHLYIAPRGDQASNFSRLVFDPIMQLSPYLRQFIPDNTRKDTWQQGLKKFRNGSTFIFRSAYHTADAIRGLSVGHIIKDEIQDLIADHMPIIDECAANWPDARFVNAGTPKTFSNMLERKWQRSTMAEWLVKCGGCNYWNFQDLKIIGLKNYICKRCGKALDIQQGQWVQQQPSRADVHQGFHVTQMMNPNTQFWRIREKLETYSLAQFYNEVLGLSYAEGSTVMTREDLVRCCIPENRMVAIGIPYNHQYPVITAGIDWGTGSMSARRQRGETQVSYTILVIGAFMPNGKWRVLHIKKFYGQDAELSSQPGIIADYLKKYRVQTTFSDWGFGEPNNRRLVNEFGLSPKAVLSIFESHTLSSEFLKWNADSNMFVVNRNEMFLKVIDAIKRGMIELPSLDQMELFIPDFTSIFMEYDAVQNVRKYDHTDPDDTFHALAYAYIAALKLVGQLSRWDGRKRSGFGGEQHIE